MSQSREAQYYNRFSRIERFEHVLLVVAFLGLLLTGLPQKYAGVDISQRIVKFLGGIESVRILHRAFAIALIAEMVFHLVSMGYRLYVLGRPASLIPGRRDFRDAVAWARFNLGMRNERPRMPIFNFGEKWDYWNVVIGLLIMLITGLAMWNPIAATKFFSGQIIPTARVVHGGEAILLLLTLGTWHLYSVFIRQLNRSMLTGRLTAQQMQEEHAEALETLASDTVERSADYVASRRQRYLPIATVGVLLSVAGLVLFLNYETIAIDTVPRQEIVLRVPEANLDEGNPAIGESIWPTLQCSRCHGYNAIDGRKENVPALRGTTLSFELFYEQVRLGGTDMPAFSTEEVPDNYLIHVWAWLSTTTAP